MNWANMDQDSQRGSYEPSAYRDDSPSNYRAPGQSPASYAPPYPSQYGADQVEMPHPCMPSPPVLDSQSPSTTPFSNNSHNRLDDAVASAVNKTDTSAFLAPDVISQITATVLQQLKAYGLDNLQGQQPPPGQPPVPPTPNASASPPTATRRTIYTPPSENNDYDSTPPPVTRIVQPGKGTPPLSSPTERKGSPLSQHSDGGSRDIRPKAAEQKLSTQGEMTTLEKIWGKLFDDGKPTTRLGQFLRGIAVHLIEDGPQGNTLIITPEKMQKFYKDTYISLDTYPWQDIFDDNTSKISRLYREVEAEHHLVQERLNERPDIPGLTPRGFERWSTLMILSHPERELARLQKAVLDMPISNPDDKRERFPKEISRRLFPKFPNLDVRKKVEQAIITHCELDLPPIVERGPPKNEPQWKLSTEKAGPPPAAGPLPTSNVPSPPTDTGTAISEYGRLEFLDASGTAPNDNQAIPPRPIERERKPYTAQPGGGKIYDGVAEIRPAQTNLGNNIPELPKEYHGQPLGAVSSPSTSAHRNLPTYEAGYVRTTTGGSSSQLPLNRLGRTRSSSMNGSGEYRRSDPDIASTDIGPGYNGLKNTPTLPPDIEEPRKYKEYDQDDSRAYDALRDRERDREREGRYQDHRYTWGDADYYRGLLGGEGGGPSIGGDRYNYRPTYNSGYRS